MREFYSLMTLSIDLDSYLGMAQFGGVVSRGLSSRKVHLIIMIDGAKDSYHWRVIKEGFISLVVQKGRIHLGGDVIKEGVISFAAYRY